MSVDLSPVTAKHGQPPAFDVLVRWEYTVTPKHQFRRFAVVSDRRRYDELASEGGATSVWFKRAEPGLATTEPDAFRLVQLTVGDRECEISRHADESSQTYVADIGADTVLDAQPVTISFTYISRTSQAGHVLHFDVDRPTRGLDVEINYDGCGIDRMRLFDYVSRGRHGRIAEEPAETGQRSLHFGYDGWVLPRAGLTFVWTLETELGSKRRLSGTTSERARDTKAA